MSKLILLSGPSCAGKTPLEKALQKFYPHLRRSMKKIVMFNSRSPRPGEMEGIDYFFRSRRELNGMRRNKQYLVRDVRGDIQAIDLNGLRTELSETDCLYEGNTFIALDLLHHEILNDISKKSVFLSPLNMAEIRSLADAVSTQKFTELIQHLMIQKLRRRLRNQGKKLTDARRKNIQIRAAEAVKELKEAWQFDFVLPNHDGEDSDNWTIFPHPIGAAAKTLLTFTQILTNTKPSAAEKWDKNLLP